MNRKCHGDYIEDMGLYRCLLDGSFTEGLKEVPAVCENCRRDVDATVHKTVVNYRRVSQCVVIDNNEFVVSSMVEGLQEAQLSPRKQ